MICKEATRATLTLWAALLAGCPDLILAPAADAGPDSGAHDAGTPPEDEPDAGPAPRTVEIRGRVLDMRDFFAAATSSTASAVAEVSLLTVGLDPPVTTRSASDGSFLLRVPENGRFVLTGQRPPYRPSHQVITAGDSDRALELLLAPSDYVETLGRENGVAIEAAHPCLDAPDELCTYAVVVGRILDDGARTGRAEPVAGIARTEILVSRRGQPAPITGPFFLTESGAPFPAAQRSIAVGNPDAPGYRGGLFVFFVERPVSAGPLDLTLSVAHLEPGGGTRYFGPIELKTYPTGVSLAVLPETGAPPPPPPESVDFVTQIYPLFLRIPEGGLGCHGCHTDQYGLTPEAGMNLFGVENAYRSLDPLRHPTRVDLTNPDASRLLTRPLFEPSGAQDHPLFAFSSVDDPNYRLVRRWIEEGALRGGPLPVSFRRDVLPILTESSSAGGAGCMICHGVTENPPAGFSLAGTADQIYLELTAEAPTDPGPTLESARINIGEGLTARSLLLIKPLSGSLLSHPTKLWASSADSRYQLIYRWIAQGYRND